MPKSTSCRLILDGSADGAWNMAVDEALLSEAAKNNLLTLRFYRWERPTLSLGYFQNYSDRNLHVASRQAAVVRRLSGGGAILHDREITYSLAIPRTHPLTADTQALYRSVHNAIVRVLNRAVSCLAPPWQLKLCDASSNGESRVQPFLCFERRSRGDVLLEPLNAPQTLSDHKVAGSAQRRRRGAVLQHGSLLLNRSSMAPELQGLNEIAGTNLLPDETVEQLADEIANELQLKMQPARSAELHTVSEMLAKTRYASSEWTERR